MSHSCYWALVIGCTVYCFEKKEQGREQSSCRYMNMYDLWKHTEKGRGRDVQQKNKEEKRRKIKMGKKNKEYAKQKNE